MIKAVNVKINQISGLQIVMEKLDTIESKDDNNKHSLEVQIFV